MSLLVRLRSFHRRRIALPAFIGSDSLVLDVGSGDKPHWRADVLIDRFPGAEHAIQRSGRAAARTSRPLFDADVTAMPFADKVFDYAICSHLLEHVVDPAGAIGEMTRVATAGYVEVPRAAIAKIIDFPSHLWWCHEIPGDNGFELVFEAKSAHAFDAEIEALVRKPDIERDLYSLIDRYFDDCVIAIHWTDHLAHRVVGTVDPLLLQQVATADVRHDIAGTLASRVLTASFSVPLRGRRRRPPVLHDDIVKPDLRTGTGEVLRPRRYLTAPVDPA